MAEPFDVTVDPAAGMTLTPSEGIAPETPIANLAPEAQIANLGPVMGPPPQAPIPHVIPPPPPLQADPKNQLAALMALGLAAGMGPRAGGAGAIQGFIQQQAAQQQQRLMQYEFAQKLADEQNLRDEQNYRTSVVLHDQQSNQLRQYLHSVSQQVASAKTPQQYDTMIASFGNMLRMAGYTRLSDNWLRSAVPFVKPSEQQAAVDAFTAWRKNPSNEQLLQQNPAEAGKAVVSVDLNGDGAKENVPLSILADKAGMSFAHDENGGLLAVPKAVGGTSAFDVKLSALMDQFRADNRREPTPAEKNKIVDQAILASKEKKDDPIADAIKLETLRKLREANAGVQGGEVTADRPDTATANRIDQQTGLTPNAIYQGGVTWALTGQMPSMGMGSRQQVVNARNAIQNKGAAIVAQAGADVPTLRAEYLANRTALNKLVPMANATAMFANTASDNLDLALQQSEQVQRSGSKLVNRYTQWAQGNLTPAAGLTQFETYIYTAAREYAKVTQGGAMSAQGLTDSAAKEAGKLLNAAQSPEAFSAAVTAMKNDMANVEKNQLAQIGKVSGTIANFMGAVHGVSAPEPSSEQTPAAAPPSDGGRVRVKGPNGETGTVPKGSTLPRGWSLQ